MFLLSTCRKMTLVIAVFTAGTFSQPASIGPFQLANRATYNIPSRTYVAAAFGDFNNDGLVDLAASQYSTRQIHLFKNNPDAPGTFSLVSGFPVAGPERQVAWADYDNDGDLDLFANAGGNNEKSWLFRNKGPSGNFGFDSLSGGVLNSPDNPQGAGWLDVNRDGWLDMFISSGNDNVSKSNSIYINQKSYSGSQGSWFQQFVQDAFEISKYNSSGVPSAGAAISENGSYSATADINNDGKQDILYIVDQEGDRNRFFVWLNQTTDGAMTPRFHDVTELVLDETDPNTGTTGNINWSGVTAWDADNDGDLDLHFAHCNGHTSGPNRPDLFFENYFGYDGLSNFEANPLSFKHKMRRNTDVIFGGNNGHKSGGLTVGDINNDGWMDLYVVRADAQDSLYVQTGSAVLDAGAYLAHKGPSSGSEANGATLGDVDNDGDLDLFLCNSGLLYLNNTNRLNKPADPRDNYYNDHPDQWEPIRNDDPRAEHYLGVMVSGASADELGKTKDGIGSRVYVYKQKDPDHWISDSSLYGQSDLIGMREIDGGSGYGSQATQVQHFGLQDNVANPHKDTVCVKAVFLTGEALWKFGVVPDEVFVPIRYWDNSNSEWDTTILAQTIEMSLLDLRKPSIDSFAIHVEPNSTIQAGASAFFWGEVFMDDNGVVERNEEAAEEITWKVLFPNGIINPSSVSLGPTPNDTTYFSATEAYLTYGVVGQLVNPDSLTDTARDTAWVTIIPADTGMLVIERSPTKPSGHAELVSPQPLAEILFQESETKDSAYAVLRDEYGNWIGAAAGASWGTVDPSRATAAAGSGGNGKGIVTRVANSGNTVGWANLSVSGSPLADSVVVRLINVSYSQLRYVDENDNIVSSVNITIDSSVQLYAEALNSLGSWEKIDVDWSAPGLVIGGAQPPSESQQWDVIPGGLASGNIVIVLDDISKSIPANFTVGEPASLVVYDNNGNPYPDANDPQNGTVTIKAGNIQTLSARLFDKFGNLLATYPLLDSIYWDVTEDGGVSGVGVLSGANGESVTYTGKIAGRIVEIEATHKPVNSSATLRDNVKFEVIPGDPYQVFIELSPGQTSPNTARPVERVSIFSSQNTQTVYAVVRDKFGNFVQMSSSTEWSEVDVGVVDAEPENQATGKGLITRTGSGTTKVTAKNLNLSLTIDTASTTVEVVPYFFTSLRIVEPSGGEIDSLQISTNDQATLLVQGQKSVAPFEWVYVKAQWENAGNLSITPEAPFDSIWADFVPGNVGSGWIRVYLPESDTTIPDTVWVDFTLGGPRDVTIEVLTDEDSLVAGYPINTSITLTNRWGRRLEGEYCEDVSFDDIFKDSQVNADGDTLVPSVIVGGDTIGLGESVNLCFNSGVASVDFLLYHAPLEAPTHEISVLLIDSDLRDTTEFILEPGPVSSIKIVAKADPVTPFPGDSITLFFDDGKTIKLVGYDAFGNLVGSIYGNWGTTGTIPEIKNPNNTPQLYYQVSQVLYESSGYIHAEYAKDSSIVDSIKINITAKPAELISAHTIDDDADGYLDGIKIQFDKAITFDSTMAEQLDLLFFVQLDLAAAGNPFLDIDSISPVGTSSTTFILHLPEDTIKVSGKSVPQTAWRPIVEINDQIGIAGDNAILDGEIVAADSAGPVVWRVEKVVNSAGTRESDVVTVTFSEVVRTPEGNLLSPALAPGDVFDVWYFDTDADSFVKIDTLFEGIGTFSNIQDNQAVFTMRNGADLNSNHFLSFAEPPLIGDEYSNTPKSDDQEVRVVVSGALGEIAVGPNPLKPVFAHEEDRLVHIQPEKAFQWARDEGGAVITTDFILPSDPATAKITGKMLIFDALGNLVYSREEKDNLIPDTWMTGDQWVFDEAENGQLSSVKFVFYWNGMTDRDRPAAPGVYRAVIFLQDGNQEPRKRVVNVGVGR